MPPTYELTCQRCSFGTRIDGLEAALDAAEGHSERRGGDHFVDMRHYAPDADRTSVDPASVSGADPANGGPSGRADGDTAAGDDD
ncbi:MAG: hypothetical protein ABEJ26_10350 [Halosimplex sp.]